MEIILLERVDKLGQMGDLVTVKSGYARNFLLPQGKAVFASKDNMKYFEEQKVQLEGENIAKKTEAKSLADNISFKEVVLIRAASESGQLYGSVSAKDIANEITNSGLTISKNQVILNKAIKSLSYEDIIVKLHPEISIKIKLNIARYARTFGVDVVDPSTIADTEAYVAESGRRVAQYITNLGAGTGLSDADREYAEKVVAGNITVDKEALKRLLGVIKASSQRTIKNYRSLRTSVEKELGEANKGSLALYGNIFVDEGPTQEPAGAGLSDAAKSYFQ